MSGKTLSRSILVFFAVQIAAHLIWTATAGPCTAAFCRLLDALPLSPGAGREFVHQPSPGRANEPDNLTITIRDRGSGARFAVPYGAGAGWYHPNAFLLALVVATPRFGFRPRRRTLAAFALLQFLLAARAQLVHMKMMSTDGPWQSIVLPAPVDTALHLAVASFSYSSLSGLWLAALLWAVLCLKGLPGSGSRRG